VAPADRRSVGVLGGTFNPPHLGHLAIARDARRELGLERVVLMPARMPPHKPDVADPGAEHRLHMCRLLIDGEDGLSVCALEIERDGPSYTVETLKAIHAGHPDLELTFVVGADTARTLPAWREPEQVLALAEFAVAARAGTEREAVLESIAGLGRAGEIRFLTTPLLEVSSSMARERVAAGEPIEELVGSAVAGYIAANKLYGAVAKALG
jgi:nicotinate-nucleotide adenylyltransferase